MRHGRATGDVDNDGDLNFVVADAKGQPSLSLTQSANPKHRVPICMVWANWSNPLQKQQTQVNRKIMDRL